MNAMESTSAKSLDFPAQLTEAALDKMSSHGCDSVFLGSFLSRFLLEQIGGWYVNYM